MLAKSFAIICFLGLTLLSGVSKRWPNTPVAGVTLQLSNARAKGQVHWDICNSSESSVFVYSFFLYGPAYGREHQGGKEIFDTTPISEDKGTVYHFPPVLLLMVPPGDCREGDFKDPELNELSGKTMSLKIGAGSDSYSVVEEARRMRQSDEMWSNPYNAIFRWSTIIESNPLQLR